MLTLLLAGDPALPSPLRIPEEARFDVIDRVATGHEAIAVVLTDIPDVLLIDTRLADSDARAVCRRVREWAPATRVLAAVPADDEAAYTTLVAGAAGAVLLDWRSAGHAEADPTPHAIAAVARGESVLLPRMARRVMHDLDAWAMRSADPLYPPPTLTATEREVLNRLGEGSSPEAIADTHSVTSHLVNLHVGFAVAKLHRYVLGAERIAAEQ